MDRDIKMLRAWMELWQKTDQVYIKFLKQYNLSLNAFLVLEKLLANPQGVEPMKLADSLGFIRQLMTLILKDLDRWEYILRVPDLNDHRRKKIILTTKGQEFAKMVVDNMENLELQTMRQFNDEEKMIILNYSQKFYDCLANEANLQQQRILNEIDKK